MAWKELTGYIVYRWEFAILTAMDMAYCDALNSELAEKRARETPPPPPNKGRKR